MHVPTLYLDTSVIGGYHDTEWMKDTRELWSQRAGGLWVFLSSGLVAQEIAGAPPEVQQTFEETFDRSTDLLPITEEIEDLAQEYLKAAVVSLKFEDDARHAAICTVHHVDHLVSWNFKHLVNVRRAAGFNAVNLLQGYARVSIVNPKELIYASNHDEDL
jgi:hypothetical protein